MEKPCEITLDYFATRVAVDVADASEDELDELASWYVEGANDEGVGLDYDTALECLRQMRR